MHATISPQALIDVEGMTQWRHAMHRHPELGFEEFRTSALVAQCLRDWGYEVTTGLAGTGLVGRLRFGSGGKSLGLRAEMDALPIEEATGLPWASALPGKMHGCGHDGHTAMLLGAAKALAQQREQGVDWNGTLHLIFQPAEELGGAGGAQRMIDEGLFSRFPCDAVFAMHNHPDQPARQMFFRTGAFLASSDKVHIVYRGKGGHGAIPHQAIDPSLPAAATVLALQSIVARNVDPLQSAVVTVGRLQAGQTYNVIPEAAELELSVRALTPEVRELLARRIPEVAHGQAASFGVECEVAYERGYPVLVNTEAETRLASRVARQLFGEDQVMEDATPLCASEDFAYMLQQRPGCYLMIGNGHNGHAGGQPSGPCSVHNPHFDFNDGCLGTGAAFWVGLAEAFFSDDFRSTPISYVSPTPHLRKESP
ncbi:amidohydrolase [Rhodoferax koreense]|uniref:Amidohydrolase n=1 Tax=Rhodoferax koreensis TaxID=1842727 RepID=A0A1P8K439_9BURK|nr:M20 aminoacylase family protein [Rhodoferax koreense]APW40780.1 amidohydrolase [Rhodoferax koreense]